MTSEDKNFDYLIIDYLTGEISEENQQLLSNLIKSNNDFKVQFDEILKLRAITLIPVIEAEKQANYKKLIEKINDTPTINLSRSWMGSFRHIAAIFILAVSVSVAFFYMYIDIMSPADTAFCYETFSPIGSQTKIILPDNTIVWLNSGSSLKYNQSYGKKDREVTLIGEGYFEVMKEKSKPFIVHADSLNVTVLGTVFNIRSYNEDENVTVNLIKGSVNVTLSKVESVGSQTMKPNEKLVFNKQTKKIELTETNASRSALWTNGKLCFVDATIEQISKDLERKYDVKIQINNEKLKKEIFSGSINLNLSLKEVLSYIDVDKKFNINQTRDTIYISSKQ